MGFTDPFHRDPKIGVSAANHNDLGGLNAGDYKHLTAAEYAILYAFDEIIQAATDTLTVAEAKRKQISNYGQNAENTQTLPAAAEGMSGRVVIATAGQGAFHLKAGASDKIYLDGTALDDGDKISLSIPAVGNFFSFFSFQNGATAYDWHVISGSGSIVDGGA